MFLFAYVGSAKNSGSRIFSFLIVVFGTFPSSSFAFCALYRYGVENVRTTFHFYSSTHDNILILILGLKKIAQEVFVV